MIRCEYCDKLINEEEVITWPGEHGKICQECWEEECDKSWWEMLQGGG